MKSQKANLALFRSMTGKTTITPPKTTGDVVKLTGYQPPRVDTYRTWRR